MLVVKAISCEELSSSESDSYWDAIGRCDTCNGQAGCGFCLSTLQCLTGSTDGPSDGSPCPSWTYDNASCPVVPNCGDYSDCGGCAGQSECAWCASETECMTISEAFSRDCRGLVFEPPCPSSYVSDNIIVGNLIVQADATFGGGALNVTGTGVVDEEAVSFTATSGDAIDLRAGNKSYFNSVGGSVDITAGSGVAKEGGSGGALRLSAGSGFGEEQYGGEIGAGGDVQVSAGASVEGTGGSISVSAGGSTVGRGGEATPRRGLAPT